jgi:hypothetical protein
MKCHDTRTAVKATLKSPSGSPVDLTGATVKFIMSKYNGAVLVNREADVLDAVNGIVCFVFVTEETTKSGMMKAEFEVTYLDTSVETFPNSGYISINFEADLA